MEKLCALLSLVFHSTYAFPPIVAQSCSPSENAQLALVHQRLLPGSCVAALEAPATTTIIELLAKLQDYTPLQCLDQSCREVIDESVIALPMCLEAMTSLYQLNYIRNRCFETILANPHAIPLCNSIELAEMNRILSRRAIGSKCSEVALGAKSYKEILFPSQTQSFSSICSSADCLSELTQVTTELPNCSIHLSSVRGIPVSIREHYHGIAKARCNITASPSIKVLPTCVGYIGSVYVKPLSSACTDHLALPLNKVTTLTLFGRQQNKIPKVCGHPACRQDIAFAQALVDTADCAPQLSFAFNALQSICNTNMSSSSTAMTCTLNDSKTFAATVGNTHTTLCPGYQTFLEVVQPSWLGPIDSNCANATATRLSMISDCQVDGISVRAWLTARLKARITNDTIATSSPTTTSTTTTVAPVAVTDERKLDLLAVLLLTGAAILIVGVGAKKFRLYDMVMKQMSPKTKTSLPL